MSMIIQFVFRPLPGADLPAVIEMAKAGAKMWKKHGAKDVSLWAVSVGETGNMAVTVPFESYADYGKCYDAMLADSDFRVWQAGLAKAGMSEWVRGNIARKIAIE